MSSSIDNRVVSMEFDNAKFERNVKESLDTLKHLDSSLDGLVDSSRRFDGISFQQLATAIDSIANRFTLMGRITQKVFDEIATKVVDVGKKLLSFNTDQITSGWDKYAEKTTSVQTIMSATGREIEYVEEQLNRLNRFSDETSYSFADMTSNIAKFTSQGIDLDKAVTQMQGIATWAASAGQNAQAASRAMYNISQAMGAGSMKLIDWKSIQNANMATKEFKEQAIAAAVAEKTLTQEGDKFFTTVGHHEVTVANFAETLQKGWLDTKTMERVFTDYGKFADKIDETYMKFGEEIRVSEILDLADMQKTLSTAEGYNEELAESFEKKVAKAADAAGVSVDEFKRTLTELNAEEYTFSMRTYKMAQMAKTFGDAVDATKDAVSTSWMNLFQTIFGNAEEQSKLWTDIANWTYDIFAEPINGLRRNIVDPVMNSLGFVTKGGAALQDLLASADASGNKYGGMLTTVLKKSGLLTDQMISDAGSVDAAMRNITGSAADLKKTIDDMLSSNTAGTIDATEAFEKYKNVAEEILKGDWGNGAERRNRLEESGFDVKTAQMFADLIDWQRKYDSSIEITEDNLWRLGEMSGELTEEQIKGLMALRSELESGNYSLEEFDEFLFETGEKYKDWTGRELLFGREEGKRGALYDLMDSISTIMESIGKAWNDVFGGGAQALRNTIEGIKNFTQKLKDAIGEGEGVKNIFRGVFSVFSIGEKAISSLTKAIRPLFASVMSGTGVIGGLIGKISTWLYNTNKAITENDIFDKAIKKVTNTLASFKTVLSPVTDAIKNFFGSIFNSGTAGALKNFFKGIGDKFKSLSEVITGFFTDESGVNKLSSIFSKATTSLGGLIDKGSAFVATNLPQYISSITTKLSEWKIEDKFKSFLSTVMDSFKGVKTFGTALIDLVKTGDTTKFVDSVKTAFSGLIEKLKSAKDAIKNFASSFISAFKSGDFSSFFESILSKFGSFGDKVKSMFTSAIEAIKKGDFEGFFKTFTDAFSGIGDKVRTSVVGIFNSFKAADFGGFFDKFLSGFGSFGEKIKRIFDGIKALFSSANTGGGLLASAGNLFNGIKFDGLTKIIDNLKIKFEGLREILDKLKDTKIGQLFVTVTQYISEFTTKLISAIPVVRNFFSGFDTNRLTGLINLISAMASLVLAFKSFKIVASIADVVKTVFKTFGDSVENVTATIKNVVSSIGGIITGIKDGFVSMFAFVKDMGKVFKRRALAKDILSFAIAVGILAGSLALLTYLPQENLEHSAIILGLIAAGLAAFIVVAGIMTKIAGSGFMAGIGVSLLAISAGVLILVAALKLLDGIDFEAFLINVVKLSLLIGILLGVSIVMSKTGGVAGATGILAFALSVILLVAALKKIQNDTDPLTEDAFLKLIKICGVLAGLAYASKFTGSFKSSAGILAMVLAVALMVSVLKQIEKDTQALTVETFLKLVLILGTLTALAGISRLAGSFGSSAGMVMMALSLVLIERALKKAMDEAIPIEEFGKYIEDFIGILILLGSLALLGRLAGSGSWKSLLLVVTMVAAMLVITKTIRTLGKVPKDELQQGAIVVEAVLLSIAAILYSAGKLASATKSTVGSLVVTLLTIGLVLGTLIYLTTLTWDDVLPGLTTIVLVLGALALVLFAVSSIGNKDFKTGSIVAMVATIVAIGGVFAALVFLTEYVNDVDSFITVCTAFALVALALGAAVLIVSHSASMDIGTALTTLGMMAAFLLGAIVLVEVFKRMEGMNVEGMIVQAASISMLLLAISAAVLILSHMPDTASAGAMFKGVLTFLELLVGLSILGAVVGYLSEIEGFANTFISGMEILGEALGNFVGGLIGGVIEGAITALSGLKSFATSLKPVVDEFKRFDDTSLSGVKAVTGLILALSAAELAQGMSTLMGGWLAQLTGNTVGDQLVKFAEAVNKYVSKVSELNEGDINKAAKISEAMARLISAIPSEGGLLDLFTGNQSTGMKNLAKNLGGEEGFGAAISSFVKSVADLQPSDVQAVTTAADITKRIAEMADSISNSGGYLQKFTGEHNLAEFGNQMVSFVKSLVGEDIEDAEGSIEHIKGMTDLLQGLDEDTSGFDTLSSILESMSSAIGSVPAFGGKVDEIFGSSDPDVFGQKIIDFIKQLKTIGEEASSIGVETTEALKNVVEASKALYQMAGVEMPEVSPDKAEAAVETGDSYVEFSDKVASVDTSGAVENARGISDVAGILGDIDLTKPEGLTELTSSLEGLSGEAGLSLDNLSSVFVTKKEGLGSAINEYFGGALTSVTTNSANLDTATQGIAETVTANVDTIFVDAEAAYQTAGENIIKAFVTGLSNSDTLLGIQDAIKNVVQTTLTTIDTQLKIEDGSTSTRAKEKGKIFGNSFVKGIEEKENKIREEGAKAAQQLVDGFKEKESAATEAGGNMVDWLITPFTTAIDALSQESGLTVQEIYAILNQGVIDAGTAGQETSAEYSKNVNAGSETAGKSGTTVADAAVAPLDDSAGRASASGVNFTLGFAAGIGDESGIAAVAEAAAKVAEAALAAVSSTIDEGSPSRKTMQSGKFFGEGFAIGIHQTASYVQSEATDMASAASNALSEAARLASEIVESDANPVITPVLDLSEVRRGASGIGNLGGFAASVSATRANMTYDSGYAREIQNRTSTPQVAVLSESALKALSGSRAPQKTVIEFTGDLAQLARVLHPVIVDQYNYHGDKLIK